MNISTHHKTVLRRALVALCVLASACTTKWNGPTGIQFGGLQRDNVILSRPDLSKVTISWNPATNSTGTVYYRLYAMPAVDTTTGQALDANKLYDTYKIYDGQELQYIYSGKDGLQIGTNYYFAVRAYDSKAGKDDGNNTVVTLSVNNGRDIPSFEGVQKGYVAGDTRVVLRWNASSTPDSLDHYNIYELNGDPQMRTPMTTVGTQYMVKGLDPSSDYRFVVRAANQYGEEDSNKKIVSVSTMKYETPKFDGVTTVEKVSGFYANRALKVSWNAPSSGSVTGYQVWMSKVTGPVIEPDNTKTDSFTQQPEQNPASRLLGTDGNAITTRNDTLYPGVGEYIPAGTTSATIGGLEPNTTYYFVVRAFTAVGGTYVTDLNMIEKSGTTVATQAPSFTGISSATSSDYNSAAVGWPKPSDDGVYNRFQIKYEIDNAPDASWSTTISQPCKTPVSSGAPTQVVTDYTLRGATVAGLTATKWYKFQVRVYYEDPDDTTKTYFDTNTKCFEAYTAPLSPSFAGIADLSPYPGSEGFTVLKATWPAASANTTYYEVVTTVTATGVQAGPAIQVYTTSGNINDPNTLFTRIPGLTPKTNYTTRVTAYFWDGTNPRVPTTQHTKTLAKTTLPTAPNGDQLKPIELNGPSSLALTYKKPTSGVYNYVMLWVTKASGDPNITETFRRGFGNTANDYFPTSAQVTPMSVGATQVTLPTLTTRNGVEGAAILVDLASLPASESQIYLTGLTPQQNYCVMAHAVYWDGSDSTTYLNSQISIADAAKCKTPDLACPANWSGITAMTQAGSSQDFRGIKLSWNTFTTDPSVTCYIEFSLTSNGTTNSSYNDISPILCGTNGIASGSTLSGANSEIVNYGITYPSTLYRKNVTARARLKLTANGATQTCEPKTIVQVSMPAQPSPIPTGAMFDPNNLPSAHSSLNGPYIDIPFKLPTAGLWSNILIFRRVEGDAAGVTAGNVCDYVLQDSAENTSTLKGPNAAPYANLRYQSGAFSDSHLTQTGATSYTFRDTIEDGKKYCYMVRGAYTDENNAAPTAWNATYYSATLNAIPYGDSTQAVVCNYAGLTSATLDGTFASSPAVVGSGDDTARVKLTFSQTPSGTIDAFYVYYSPTGWANGSSIPATPWQIVYHNSSDSTSAGIANAGDYDPGVNGGPNGYSPFIYVGGQGKTVAGPGSFLVRPVHFGTACPNSPNFSVATLSGNGIPNNQSNYAYIPKTLSGLAYDYYMMRYEAAETSNSSTWGTDPIYSDTTKYGKCNAKFYNPSATDFNAAESDTPAYIDTTFCGSHPTTAKVKSVKGAIPKAASWTQAWTACRNSSNGVLAMRLPTAEEWRRAAKVGKSAYSTLWSTYQNTCNVNSSTGARTTGANLSCASFYDIVDMAGNMREWVDARAISHQPGSRFGLNPFVGKWLSIDLNNALGYTRLIHEVTAPFAPSGDGLGLLMGSDFRQVNSTNFRFPSFDSAGKSTPVDAELESWEDATGVPDASRGFRCMGIAAQDVVNVNDSSWNPGLVSWVEKMALPVEPTYTSGDLAASPAAPENVFIGDVKPESVSIPTTGDSVTITWSQWKKGFYGENGGTTEKSGNFTYYVYRFPEPIWQDIRPSIPWALDTGGQGPYNAATPLDPWSLETQAGTYGKLSWLPTTTGPVAVISETDPSACNSTTKVCTFTDSNSASTSVSYPNARPSYSGSFSPRIPYLYLIYAKDGDGNYMPPRVQRYRPPYFVGDTSSSAAGLASATFRHELRYRRVTPFLLDEYTQNVSGSQQVMAFVPMDKSGADHDFYIYKYEASSKSSGSQDGGGGSTHNLPLGPKQSSGTTYLVSACIDQLYRTISNSSSAANFPAECGTGTAASANGTSVSVKSTAGVPASPGASPTGSGNTSETFTYGDAWKACRNSTFDDLVGLPRKLYLVSNSEWVKAADWGDTHRDGNIDENTFLQNAGYTLPVSVASMEPDDSDVPVAGGSGPCVSGAGNNSAPLCLTRYGVVQMIGTGYEMVADRGDASGSGTHGGWDNGMDGLFLNFTMPNTGTLVDLLRGTLVAGGSNITTSGLSIFGVDGSNSMIIRGGPSLNKSSASRWLQTRQPSSAVAPFRCGY